MYIFPIKSCAPIAVNEMNCSNLGAEYGVHLRDRVFAIVRSLPPHECVTAMQYSKMVLITPRIEDCILTIDAPGMNEIQVDISKLYQSTNTLISIIQKDEVLVVDCGDEAAKWLSNYLVNKDEAFRLVFYPSNEPKPFIKPKGYLYRTAERMDTGSLHDETSYMLMNMGSFDDLNKWLEKSVGPLQFRPNIVVSGADAWSEDKWKFIKIGQEVIFKTIQPCTRCTITTIDPSTGERNKKEEPLRTLRKFRLFSNISHKCPVFGIHVGLRRAGTIRIGDNVYVSV
ncbi:hypothetical protein PVAND_012471 [Polypedilum vanderplanki]|uniref:MOSC domain-containing protein n=1 Tax=Polypedilum vanderplanki TaxID=319348 RepID=A0A9J6CNJ5_POLVA|nr:hypothetical protein PVAND_012471 [Polypedilum vanderplanki]